MEYIKKIAQNRQASFKYFIEESFEVGIVLRGSEVKSLRSGRVNIEDAHATNVDNEVFLHNCYIAEYDKANRFNHATRRPRKLLLHARQIRKIIGKIRIKGYTLIALLMYFNAKNMVKVKLGLAKGKKLHDKREAIKEQDWQRTQARTLRKQLKITS